MGALGAILLLCDTSPYAGDTYCDQWAVAGPGPWPATRCHPGGVITITPGNCGHMSQQQNQHFKYILQLFQTHMDLDKRAANSSPKATMVKGTKHKRVFGKIFVFSVLCVVWRVGGGGEWQPTTHLQLMMHNTVVPACHGGTNSSQGQGGLQYQLQ